MSSSNPILARVIVWILILLFLALVFILGVIISLITLEYGSTTLIVIAVAYYIYCKIKELWEFLKKLT